MGFDFTPLLYFICRSCGQIFPDIDQLKTHKIKCHLGECLKTKCIIFQEIVLGADEWIPPNVCTSHSGSHQSNELTARNATVTLRKFIRQPTFSFRNPYVSLRPLTSEELQSKAASTELKTGVSCSATRKRSIVLAEAATTQSSSNLTCSVSEPNPEENTAVALLPKLTKFCEEFDWSIGVVNEKSKEAKIQSDQFNVSDTIKLEPAVYEVDSEVLPKIESQICSSFLEDQNDFTEDFLNDSTNYEPQTAPENSTPDSFNDCNNFDEDDRPSTADFTFLAEEKPISLLGNDTQSQNQTSTVNCIMCETQLVTAEEEKNHLDNCWLHNKSRHIYCFICNIRFKYPLQLKKHQEKMHNEFHSVTSSMRINLEDSDDEDDIDESTDLDALPLAFLPLAKWIQKRRKRFPDLIILDPDPTGPAYLLSNCEKLTCKLCKEKLELDLVKNHVQTCWAYNKERRVYCDLCQTSFDWPGQLRRHNQMLHPVKSLRLPAFLCLFCHEEFPSFPDLRDHETSMTEFFQTMTAKQSLFASAKTQGIHFPAPSQHVNNTSHNKTGEGRPALKMLLERSHLNKLGRVISKSPETCALCLRVLQSKHHTKLHLENCWLHNKARHVYCNSCKTYFKHPRALKLHNLSQHSEARSETDTETDVATVEEPDSNSNVPSDLLPLGQWIKMRRRDYGDVIHFDPDPATLKNCNRNIIINPHRPITCKLCKFKCTSTGTVKGHAATCWFFNKQKHRFCVPCQILYKSPTHLQTHIRNHHLEIVPRPSFCCMECKQVFRTFEEFKTHEEAREEFFKGVRECVI